MSLTGRHALVTGGGSGVGRAIARTLADAGANVTVCGRRAAPLAETAGDRMFAHPADVTDEASVDALYEAAGKRFGPVDIVVANAGAASSAPAHKVTLDDWRSALDVNLTGAFLTVRPAVAPMARRGAGRIVFVASTAGLKGYRYTAPYVAAKHGVIGLMRALAAELAATGVTVNAICPGFTDTDLLAGSIDRIVARTGRTADEARDSLTAANPQRRLIQPEEIAATLMWLVGDAAGSITGQAISVSGGETW